MIRSLLIASVLFMSARAADAQSAQTFRDPPSLSPSAWRAGVSYIHDFLTGERSAWQRVEGTVGRRYAFGAFYLSAAHVTRFSETAVAAGADVYADLWRGGYLNVAFHHAPDARVIAGSDLFIQFYQTIGSGIEIAGSYQLRDYVDELVHIPGAQVGLYAGNWYLRSKTTLVPLHGETGISQVVAARYYGADVDHFVDVALGAGRSVEVLDAPALVVLARTLSASIRYQRPLADRLRLTAILGYSDDDFYRRTTMGLGAAVVW